MSSRPDWLTLNRFALILVAMVVASYAPMLLGWETFFLRDFGYFGYPLAHYHRECFWRGELPLWNPLSCSGLPFLAQWNTLTLYPGSLIYLLLPLPWSLNLFSLAHLILGGLGMFVLARRWTGQSLGAGLAGVAFTFSGLAANFLLWPNNMAALGWMPWVVWLVERAWTEGGWRRLALAALAGGMQMLSGAPEVILFTWLMLAAMMGGQAIWNGTWRWNWRVPARFAAVVALVGGLAAAQLLPFWQLIQHSDRSSQYSDTISWPMPPWGWANFLVPLFRCYRAAVGVYFQPGQDWTSSYYLGIGVFALAVAAVWRSRSRRVWLLGILLALALVLALGEAGGVYPVLRKCLPQLGFVRFTVKFVVVAAFCAPLLAAFAVARLQNNATELRAHRPILVVAGLGLIAITGIVWCSYRYPLRGELWSASVWHGLSRAGFLVGLVGLLCWRGRASAARWAPWSAVGLLLLVWLDLQTHAPSPAPGIKPDALAAGLVSEQWRQEQEQKLPAPATFRAYTPRSAHEVFQRGMISDPAKDYVCHRLVLFPNCNLLEGVPQVDGFYSLYLKPQRDAWSLLFFAPTNNAMTPMLDFLGVTREISPTNVFSWEPRTTAMPLATLGQTPAFAEGNELWRGLASSAFDPRRTVYLPPQARSSLTATQAVAGRILSETIHPHQLDFEVESEGPAMLVLAQSYYEPWTATVDTKPVRLWKANGGFQAVEVPGGRHAVRLAYRDRKFQVGAWISMLSLGLCGVLCFGRGVERRTES